MILFSNILLLLTVLIINIAFIMFLTCFFLSTNFSKFLSRFLTQKEWAESVSKKTSETWVNSWALRRVRILA